MNKLLPYNNMRPRLVVHLVRSSYQRKKILNLCFSNDFRKDSNDLDHEDGPNTFFFCLLMDYAGNFGSRDKGEKEKKTTKER